MEERLRERMTHMENPSLATYAKPSEVRLRATAKAPTAEAAEAMLRPVVDEVCALLGDVVYGVDVASLEAACSALLRERGMTLASAESCTGGQIAQRMTALPGASQVYRGGVVSYWTDMKADVLGVSREILAQYGAVSEQTARHGPGCPPYHRGGRGRVCHRRGRARPDERGNPVGLVFIGLDTPEGTFCRRCDFGRRRRDRIQELARQPRL